MSKPTIKALLLRIEALELQVKALTTPEQPTTVTSTGFDLKEWYQKLIEERDAVKHRCPYCGDKYYKPHF